MTHCVAKYCQIARRLPCRTLKSASNQISEQPKSFSCCGKPSTTRPSRSCTVVPSPLTVFMPTRPALFAELRKLCSARPISLSVRILGMIVERNVGGSRAIAARARRGSATRTQTFLKRRNYEKHVGKHSSRNPLLSWTGAWLPSGSN